jgi:hypothetical protein
VGGGIFECCNETQGSIKFLGCRITGGVSSSAQLHKVNLNLECLHPVACVILR